MSVEIPESLRVLVELLGDAGRRWADGLPALLRHFESAWRIDVGAPLSSGAGGIVFEATTSTGRACVLKAGVPSGHVGPDFRREVAVLRLGRPGYVALLASDVERRVILLERLGRCISDVGLSIDEQLLVIARTLQRAWVSSSDVPSLATGAEKAGWLRAFIQERTAARTPAIERALEYTHRREAAFDQRRAVVVHGDAGAGNVLEDGAGGFKLIDPEGLLSEPAHDLAIPLRDSNRDLKPSEAIRRCALVADATGINAQAIWEWSFIERLTTGLYLEQLRNTSSREFLDAAERLADVEP